ncbi:MAG: thioredoxin [Actinobacteria bacterium]|nr:thioredoxin [Actinomycetota bacterium]
MSSKPVTTCPACGTRNRVPASASGTPRCASCRAPLPWLVAAGEENFDSAVKATVPVLVDLWAPWCAPCRTIGPLLEQAARENAGRLKVVKVNVDNAPRLSRRFNVQGIPTMLMFQGGREVSRQVGALPKAKLQAWIGSHLL